MPRKKLSQFQFTRNPPSFLAFILFEPLVSIIFLGLQKSLDPTGLVFILLPALCLLGSFISLSSGYSSLGRAISVFTWLCISTMSVWTHWERPSIFLLKLSFIGLILLQHLKKSSVRQKLSFQEWLRQVYGFSLVFYSLVILSSLIFLSPASPPQSFLLIASSLIFSIITLQIKAERLTSTTQLIGFITIIASTSLSILIFGSDLLISWIWMILVGINMTICLQSDQIKSWVKERFLSLIDKLFLVPQASLPIFFFTLSLLGGLALVSPLSAMGSKAHAGIDAAFTAVSAACVTGLITLDTVRDFSFFGQFVILLLIQLGGLGIMSLSALILYGFRRRLSLAEEDAVAGTMGQRSKTNFLISLKQVFQITFTCELLGSLILFVCFMAEGDYWLDAVWRACFTAISAFCNAGFALQSDNLISYQSNPIILHTCALLIMAGGLSPAFIVEIPKFFRGKKVSLQHRFVAFGNLWLWLAGGLMFLLLEWNQAFSDMSWPMKMTHAWFQSVTSRTAGFNAIDLSELSPGSTFITMALMFVGGSPGGTAGGIKVTTIVILLYLLKNFLQGRSHPLAFKREISKNSIFAATAVITSGLLIGSLSLTAILSTQRLDALPALFEVLSASATVGLSLGATNELNVIGKAILIGLMFIGRLGPMSLMLLFVSSKEDTKWKLVSEDVKMV